MLEFHFQKKNFVFREKFASPHILRRRQWRWSFQHSILWVNSLYSFAVIFFSFCSCFARFFFCSWHPIRAFHTSSFVSRFDSRNAIDFFFCSYCYCRVCAWFPFFISVDYFVSVELFFSSFFFIFSILLLRHLLQ